MPWTATLARHSRCLAALLALCGPMCGALAAPPPLVQTLMDDRDDHPRQTLNSAVAALTQARSQRDGELEFWLLVAIVDAFAILEDSSTAAQYLEQARQALGQLKSATDEHRLWVELAEFDGRVGQLPPIDLARQVSALRPRVDAVGDLTLSLAHASSELWFLRDAQLNDRAWLAAEALEKRARSAGKPLYAVNALIDLGSLAARTQTDPEASVDLLQRALQLLGDTPARFRRSIVEWELGNAYNARQRHDAALPHLRAAAALSRQIDDTAGLAAANISISQALLGLQRPAEALPLLREAQRQLLTLEDSYRMPKLAALTIEALARLKRPEVLREIDVARRWDNDTQEGHARAMLLRSMALGYAAAQHHEAAYKEMTRAHEFERAAASTARDDQLLHLKTRYDTARRDAENSELRLHSQTAQLELQSQLANQRMLWAAVVALSTLLLGAGYFGRRALLRRRVLADLAMRDELTGQPNRRAILAYARAQFEQARQLDVPMTLALIDLDHFKRVNDTWGHAVGDAALRSFVKAVSAGLRHQDRLGRWGGEEFLLVMPGTTAAELPLVFERLRSLFSRAEIGGIPAPHGLTFSMGAAELSPEDIELDAFIARADAPLYEAKAAGRNALRLAA